MPDQTDQEKTHAASEIDAGEYAQLVTTGAPKQARKRSAEDQPTLFKVYECLRWLHDRGVSPTRELIAQKTGLPLTTVDDRIKVLRGEGYIDSQPQCYVPLKRHAPARHTGMSILESGEIKMELGDDAWTLTPEEARRFSILGGGFAIDHGASAKVEALLIMLNKQEAKLKKQAKQMEALMKRHGVVIDATQQPLEL